MPKLKPGTVIPTPDEEVIINAGIAAAPDSRELDDEWLAKAKPTSKVLPPEIYSALVAKRLLRHPKAVKPKFLLQFA